MASVHSALKKARPAHSRIFCCFWRVICLLLKPWNGASGCFPQIHTLQRLQEERDYTQRLLALQKKTTFVTQPVLVHVDNIDELTNFMDIVSRTIVKTRFAVHGFKCTTFSLRYGILEFCVGLSREAGSTSAPSVAHRYKKSPRNSEPMSGLRNFGAPKVPTH